jgi:hypothetical protein
MAAMMNASGSIVGNLLKERGQTLAVETGCADREGNMWTFARRAIELFESCLRKA